MKRILNGTCLCKSVSLSFPVLNNHFDACHCGMCRTWSGGPAMMVYCAEKPVFKGEENVAVYSSSDWAERGFCNKCGTHLFYRLKHQEFTNVPVGLLDKTEDFEFHVQIYVDNKPNNYNFAEKTEMMTEAQVIEKFAPKA